MDSFSGHAGKNGEALGKSEAILRTYWRLLNCLNVLELGGGDLTLDPRTLVPSKNPKACEADYAGACRYGLPKL